MKANGKKYGAWLPVLLAVCLLVIMAVGGSHFTTYLQKQIFLERTTQLNEITAQVRANLNNALDFHWNYLTISVNMLRGRHFTAKEDAASYIGEMEAMLETDGNHAMLMLLDSQGNCYDDGGKHGIWTDIDRISGGEERYTFISDSSLYEDSYWTFVQRLDVPLAAGDGTAFTHVVLLKDVNTLTNYYDSNAYGGRNETYMLKNNGTRMHDNISADNTIQAYNVLKVLEEMEGQRYPDLRAMLEKQDVISADFTYNGTEYYYCLMSLEEYDTLILFLIPAQYVAYGTVNMMRAVIRMLLVLAAAITILLMAAIFFFARHRSSQRLYRQEQENLRRQEEMNEKLEESNAMLARSKETAEQAFQIAEEANRAKSSFLSNMSHDIRTPMNAVVGFAALLARDAEKPDKVREYTEKITASSKHLLGLINDILDISKIEAGKTTLNLSDENMMELMEGIDSFIRPQMKAKGHTFEICCKDIRHAYVVMDKLRLNQILLNLLSNAVKYTPDGGRIVLTMQELPQSSKQLAHYRFMVEDNGYGMSEAYVQKIFQAFTREEDSVTNKIQGTGLGMAITKNLLDLMGGSISVQSEKNKGSVFTVDLEFAVSDCPAVQKPEGNSGLTENLAEEAEEKEEEGILRGMHILVAEDNEINAEILKELLDMAGAACDIYENGKLAAEAFADSEPGQYQLILMDVQMPVMNGYEATRTIRALNHPLAKKIPIIAMTANAFAEDIRDARAAGMNGHAAKPVDMDLLEQTVRAVLKEAEEV